MKNSVALLGVMLAAVLGTGIFLQVMNPSSRTSEKRPADALVEESPEVTPEPYIPPRPAISVEEVDTLYFGLPHEQVEEKLGREHDEVYSEYVQGVDGYTSPYAITWYVWNNEDGPSIHLGFVNNKLEKKELKPAASMNR